MLSLPFNPFSALTSKIFGATTLALAMALALSHCSDKRHTRQRDEARATIVQMEAASKANLATQIAQKQAWEAKSDQLAKEADSAHQEAQNNARALASDYADAHRVRPEASRIGPARPAGQGNDPGIPVEVPETNELVAITREDLQACTDLGTYAIAAHNNAVDKIEEGLAMPEVGFGK